MKRMLCALSLMLWCAWTWAAVPTVDAVQAEVQAGRYEQAQTMMQEVVAARPQSARARYVYAEILAHNGRFADALREAREAQRIDPAIAFTDPERFKNFERSLEREQNAGGASPLTQRSIPMATPAAENSRGLPAWVWGLGGALIAVLLWRAFASRRRTEVGAAPLSSYGGASMGANASGYAPGYGPTAAPARSGPGWLGTGVAAAGGFAAGMLAEKMLDGHHAADAGNAAADGWQPGVFDNDAGTERALEERPIDFGSGDGWGGAGDAGSGADVDSGGSSDDGW